MYHIIILIDLEKCGRLGHMIMSILASVHIHTCLGTGVVPKCRFYNSYSGMLYLLRVNRAVFDSFLD